MSSVAGGILRRFIDGAVELGSLDTPASSASVHPLGFGIKSGAGYSLPGRPRIFLPTSGPGLDRVAGEIGGPINLIGSEFHDRAWGLMLGSPQAIVEVAVPSAEQLLAEGITPAGGRSLTMRRVIAGSVFHEVSANDSANFGQVRVAGVATLTVQIRANKFTEDAWVKVQWLTTTRALAEHVEPYVDLDSFRVTSPAPRIAVIALDPFEWLLDDDEYARVRRSAAAAGFSLVIHRYSAATQGAIEQEIRTNPSSALVIVGTGFGASRVREAFNHSSNSNRVIHLEQDTATDLPSLLREHFAGLAGIAPSLTMYPPPVETNSVAHRPQLPVARPERCLHDGSDRPYVLDGQSGAWWTRDTKGDGGAVFKRYHLEGSALVHVADVDGEGNDMPDKHKGPTGKTISISGLHGCSFPASHLS